MTRYTILSAILSAMMLTGAGTAFAGPPQATATKDVRKARILGLGTGTLREHFDAIVKGGGRFYLSGGSIRARTRPDVHVLEINPSRH